MLADTLLCTCQHAQLTSCADQYDRVMRLYSDKEAGDGSTDCSTQSSVHSFEILLPLSPHLCWDELRAERDRILTTVYS